MNSKFDEKLCKQYPKIFAQRNMPVNQTAMCWGFQCGDGWYALVDSLCFLIQTHIDYEHETFNKLVGWQKKHKILSFIHKVCYPLYTLCDKTRALPKEIKKCTQVVASTVKEKFGGLRFYVSGGDYVTESYIRFAEFMSNSICENCGTTDGVEQTEGWIYTMCKSCLAAQKNELAERNKKLAKLIKRKTKNGASRGRSKARRAKKA